MYHRVNVLDVVRAVTAVAPHHPEVAVWWYVPRLLENPNIELLVEVDAGKTADLDAIGREAGALLHNASVSVALHAGAVEERRLFRVLSRVGSRRQPA